MKKELTKVLGWICLVFFLGMAMHFGTETAKLIWCSKQPAMIVEHQMKGVVIMEEMTVSEKVIEIIAEELEIESDKITPESSLIEDLGADSTVVYWICNRIEDDFHIMHVDDGEHETVQEFIDYVDSQLKKA